MYKQILFVQGAGVGVHDTWDNKLVRSLECELGVEYAVFYPHMPNEANPRYASWKAALLDAIDALEDGAALVGHSLGGAFLAQVLGEQWPTRRLGAISLIATPFFGEGGWQSDETGPLPHLAARFSADVPVFLYHGTMDDLVPVEHLQLYAKALPQATIRLLANRDHQLNNDLSDVARDLHNVL